MGEFIFGRHAVYHLMKAGRRPALRLHLLKGSELMDDALVAMARGRNVPVDLEGRSFSEKFEGASHQGVVLESGPYPYQPLDRLYSHTCILVCDGLQDPQNLGALSRSAYLLGVGGVVIPENRAVSITAGVCKAAAGAVEYLDICRTGSLANAINLLKENGFWIYGADQSAERAVFTESFPAKVVVVIGGEGKGLGRLVRERCDLVLKIPMSGVNVESYNASVAGALFLFEVFRQKCLKSL